MSLRTGEVYFYEQDNGVILPESVSLFGLSISFYGLFLMLAAFVGLVVVNRIVRRKKQDTEKCLTLFTIVVLASLMGARLFYVMFDLQMFVENPIGIFRFRSGGLSYFGSVFGAWFVVNRFCRRMKTDFFSYADTFSMGAACAAPFIWTGCALVGEPLGRFYEGIFSVKIKAEYYGDVKIPLLEQLYENALNEGGAEMYVQMHPVALYGMVFSVILLVVLCIISAKAKTEGTVFTAYLAMNAVMVLILE